jgi:hypothetical protein
VNKKYRNTEKERITTGQEPPQFTTIVARVRRRGDRPPSSVMDIYLVNVGRQGILCLLAVKNGMGVAT